MTQRTRQAIMEYWIAKHSFYWRRYSRSFLLVLFSSLILSQAAFAEETRSEAKPVSLLSLVSKEAKPVPAKASAKKASAIAPAKKTAVMESVPETAVASKKGPELPEVSEADEKADGATKYTRGTVSAKNGYGVAVVYGNDPVKGELEAWMEFNKSTRLTGYKNFASIEEGDKVNLTYKQLKKSGRRILKEISLTSKKPKEEPAPLLATVTL